MTSIRINKIFEACAAPSAIEHQIDLARDRANKAERDLKWLWDLWHKRQRQIADGEWPAPTPEGIQPS